MPRPFYITTTLPYVNGDPHVGFAMEVIRADIIARYKKLHGYDVFFNTGTDEHGVKIFRKAEEAGVSPKAYVDEKVKKFIGLKDLLGLLSDLNFIRTTDPGHIKSAQEFWKVCDKNGFIYKKSYSIKYCVGCELEKTESELEEGKCPLHPKLPIEIIEEENYFFKFSAFEKKLLDFYKKNSDFVLPATRYGEIKSFVEHGLEDFIISRLKEKMPWGIPVPDDESQVMYVWFDALVNYVSAIGYPLDMDKFRKWQTESGGMVQYCGKDNLRQQSAMWQAMLMSAGLSNSQKIIINGFITAGGGLKMSKSLGNVVDPYDVVKEYGTDALRYFVARELHPFEDSPFSMDRFKESYNANLANGLGNLVSRVMKMAEQNKVTINQEIITKLASEQSYERAMEGYDIKTACDYVWRLIQSADRKIQEEQPFKVVKIDLEKGKKIISGLVIEVKNIAVLLRPILPETAEKILELVASGKSPEVPLFIRKD